jgi:hypothetical protein
LASRLVHLESMLRRLVSSPLHRLDEADEAPAGPGVFLLSDSDQISSYYVEACQTLRVGIGNLVRGGRGGGGSKGSRGGRSGYSSDSGLKAKLAEHIAWSDGFSSTTTLRFWHISPSLSCVPHSTWINPNICTCFDPPWSLPNSLEERASAACGPRHWLHANAIQPPKCTFGRTTLDGGF